MLEAFSAESWKYSLDDDESCQESDPLLLGPDPKVLETSGRIWQDRDFIFFAVRLRGYILRLVSLTRGFGQKPLADRKIPWIDSGSDDMGTDDLPLSIVLSL